MKEATPNVADAACVGADAKPTKVADAACVGADAKPTQAASATSTGRILAIDPGKARLGLAISDPERRIVSPLTTWQCRDRAQDGGFLQTVIANEQVSLIVIGLPVHLSGTEGAQARFAREFGVWLAKLTGVPCVFYDERFTTREAESRLWEAGLTHKQRKARRDRVAAQILLQAYLDADCPAETAAQPLDSDPGSQLTMEEAQ